MTPSGTLAGWTPGVGLDETGRAQAERLGERLAGTALAAVLTVEEAARWCHISPNTLNYLRVQRRLAPAIRIGRRVFFTPSDLNDWLEAQREEPE